MGFNNRQIFWASIIVVFTLLVSAFINSGVEPLTSMAIAHETPDVIIVDTNGFVPSEILVKTGQKLVWENKGSYVSVLWQNSANSSFTSPIIENGQQFSYVYKYPGTYRYVDVNFGYKGTVIVSDSKEQLNSTPAPVDKTDTPEQSYLKSCASCSSGCTQDSLDCTRCNCPCTYDQDCDDRDSCTIDLCSSEPVKCIHKEKAGCSKGLVCTVEGQTATIDGQDALCSKGVWLKKKTSSYFGLAFSLALIFGAIGFVAIMTFRNRNKPVYSRRTKH